MSQSAGAHDTPRPGVEAAVVAMGLDLVAAEVVTALEDNGIASVLLKGPSTAFWLYADNPDLRTYLDIDLLVRPSEFEAAERVLSAAGFTGQGADRPSERKWMKGTSWTRTGPPQASVDLHRSFHGVDDSEAWWATMSAHTQSLEVGGRAVSIPDASGCALIATLHDTSVWRSERSEEDLRRALDIFGDDVWSEALNRAATISAGASFALGLSRLPAGREKALQLGLSSEVPAALAVHTLADGRHDARNLGAAANLGQRIRSTDGWRARAQVCFDILFPSSGYLRESHPLARRGFVGMLAVRVARPVSLLGRSPGVIAALLAARKHTSHHT